MVNEILLDIWVILKLVVYLLYAYIETFAKACLIPFQKQRKDVKGQTVLVTGAAGGIGHCLVSRFFDLGCTVICIDYNQKELNKMRDHLLKEKSSQMEDANNNIESMRRLHFFTVDISSIDEVKSVANRIKQEVGTVDILINNAGIMNKGKYLTQLSEQEIQNIFNVNVLAHFWLIREFLPAMIKKNHGHICNIASVCGLMGSYKLTDYCSSKFAVVGLTESLRSELKAINPNNKVQTTLVCPFHVQTKMFHGVEFARLNWAGLSMTPEKVADSIVNGILTNKDIVKTPNLQIGLFYLIKNLTPTKFVDRALQMLEVNGAMDKYKNAE